MSVFVGDIVNMSVTGFCFGQKIVLTHFFKCTIGSGVETLSTSMNDLNTAVDLGGVSGLMEAYLDCLIEDYSSQVITSQVIKPVRTAYIRKVAVHSGQYGAGTVANDSAAIVMRTDLAGRANKGTKHIGPIADTASSEGMLQPAFTLLLDALAVKLATTFVIPTKATEWQPVIYHRVDGTTTKITNYAIGLQSRVQRRRTVGLGE